MHVFQRNRFYDQGVTACYFCGAPESADVHAVGFPIGDDRPGKLQRNPRDTSREAARDVRGRTGTVRRRVFEMLLVQSATDFELRDAIGGADSTVRTRRKELEEDGLVQDSGERRPSPTGQASIVWELTERGRSFG